MRFIGNIEAKMDAKGRVFLPATFRKILQNGDCNTLIIRKDAFQQCLVLYQIAEWNAETSELRQRLSKWDAKEQQIFRQFVADAEQVSLDANGRILIPKRYIKSAELTQNVRFLGMGDTIELWNAENSNKFFLEANAFGKALEEVMTGNKKNEG